MLFNRGRFLFQPSDGNAREMFAQMLATTDPRVLMYGFMDVNMMVGGEQQLREFSRVFAALPDAALKPALGTSLATNLVVRETRTADGLIFCVVNPGFWPVTGSVALTGAGQVRGRPGGPLYQRRLARRGRLRREHQRAVVHRVGLVSGLWGVRHRP